MSEIRIRLPEYRLAPGWWSNYINAHRGPADGQALPRVCSALVIDGFLWDHDAWSEKDKEWHSELVAPSEEALAWFILKWS